MAGARERRDCTGRHGYEVPIAHERRHKAVVASHERGYKVVLASHDEVVWKDRVGLPQDLGNEVGFALGSWRDEGERHARREGQSFDGQSRDAHDEALSSPAIGDA